MNLGPLELVVLLVVALLVFGPKRLPEVGRQVGGALREMKKVQDSVRTEINAVINAEPEHASSPSLSRSAPKAVEEPDHDAAESDARPSDDAHGADPGSPDLESGPIVGFDGPSGSFS